MKIKKLHKDYMDKWKHYSKIWEEWNRLEFLKTEAYEDYLKSKKAFEDYDYKQRRF